MEAFLFVLLWVVLTIVAFIAFVWMLAIGVVVKIWAKVFKEAFKS